MLEGRAIEPVLAELSKAPTPQAANEQPEDIDLTISNCDLVEVGTLKAFLQWASGRNIRSLNFREVSFTIASINEIESVVRSLHHISAKFSWTFSSHGEHLFQCADSNSLYVLAKARASDGGDEYEVRGSDDYSHRFVVSL